MQLYDEWTIKTNIGCFLFVHKHNRRTTPLSLPYAGVHAQYVEKCVCVCVCVCVRGCECVYHVILSSKIALCLNELTFDVHTEVTSCVNPCQLIYDLQYFPFVEVV